MIHDWTVLIMWVTSLGVTAWGQSWRAKAERRKDVIQYMIEGEADESGTADDSQDTD